MARPISTSLNPEIVARIVEVYLQANGDLSMKELGDAVGVSGTTAGKYITEYLKTRTINLL